MRREQILAGLPAPVLVVGGYGYRNVGDEAILAGLLRLLSPARVTVVSRSPAETMALHGVRAIGVGGAVAALRRHRTVLIGGGGLFGRGMGRLGRLLPAYGLVAAAAGRTVVLEGVGIDDDLSGPGGSLVRRLVSTATRVTVRDAASAKVTAGWGVPAHVAPDLSAAMPAAPGAVGERLLRQAGVDLRRPVVGLCLTALNPDLGSAVERAVVEAVEQLPEFEFCAIPMSQHPFASRHNDLLLVRRVQAATPRVKVLEGLHHPASILSAFGRLAAVVGMRYHSLLFAERAGIAVVPIAYAAKCEAWLAERSATSVPPTAQAVGTALSELLTPARMAS